MNWRAIRLGPGDRWIAASQRKVRNAGMSYRWNGLYGTKGTKERPAKTNGNKGVYRAYMAQKRLEAEKRNAQTLSYRKRAYARERGYERFSDIPLEERL